MHGCRSLRGFDPYRAKLICGFAASRAELRLAASPPPVRKASGFPSNPRLFWRLRRPRRSLKNFQTNYRKARGFPHGRRQSRDAKFRTGGGKPRRKVPHGRRQSRGEVPHRRRQAATKSPPLSKWQRESLNFPGRPKAATPSRFFSKWRNQFANGT